MGLIRIIFGIMILAAGMATLIVAVQSSGTMTTIDASLTRHVEQLLLERATQSVVIQVLESQNQWLWISAVFQILAGVVTLISIKK